MLLLFLLIFFLLFCHQLNSISTDSLPSSANANLNSLLSDVTTKARPTGFYNSRTLIGHTQFYGLALCRADLSLPSHDCSSCLTNASSSLTTRCSNKKWGTIWYEKCLLRYSNDSFFGVVDDGGKSYCGVEKVSSAIGMATIELATSLVAVAANSKLMFAANESAVGDGSQSQTSYVLLQCTRDLSSGECETCLKKGMSVVTRNCTQTNGWRYLSGSCIIRYEIFAFFNTSAIGLGESPVPQPAAPAQSPVPQPAAPAQSPVPLPAVPAQSPVPQPAAPAQSPVPQPAPPTRKREDARGHQKKGHVMPGYVMPGNVMTVFGLDCQMTQNVGSLYLVRS